MKKNLVLSTIFSLVCVFLFAAASSVQPALQITQTSSQIKLSLDSSSLRLKTVSLDNETYHELNLEGFHKAETIGQPDIPFYTTTIAIPPRGDFTISINEDKVRTFSDISVKPYLEDNSVFNKTDYDKTGLFPARLVEYSEPAILRDFRILQISIFPLQWDSNSNTLRLAQEMELVIDFNDNPGVNELDSFGTYSPVFEKLYASTIANFEYYRNTELTPVHPKIQFIYGNTTDQAFLQKLNDLVAWKRQKGFDVQVASTAVTGSSNTQIRTYLQNQYANPSTRPDFIILAGDTSGSFSVPTWYESLSGYNGEGDYPYTHLAGGDLLGDVFIGRLSAENSSQFDVLVNKIFAYEKNINNSPAAATWLDRMLLIGDPSSSGISTIYTNKFIKERAKQANPDYTFIENYSGGYSSTMNSGINQGVALFNYRGYIGMSGWSPSSSLINGNKLPHTVIITCSTGSFGNGTSTSEAFIRLGTSATPSGALTSIGMATSGTHTGFNNSLTAGIFDGILTHNMRTMGEALLSGRLNIYNVYNATNPNQANYFSHWCNLMGDPSVEVFIGIPKTLNISAPANIPAGTHMVDVFITDDDSNPVSNISVTMFSATTQTIVAKGFTNQYGMISLVLPETLSGNLIYTASAPDCKPVQLNAAVNPSGSLVFENSILDDSGAGNSNGIANPGETISLVLSIKNTTNEIITGISGVLTTADPHITIDPLQNQATYPAIVSGAIALSNESFSFTVSNNPPASHDIRFILTLTDSQMNEYVLPFHVQAINAEFSIQNVSITAGTNSVLDPSENGFIGIAIQNNSTLSIDNLYMEMASMNDLLVVVDSLSFYGSIPAGAIVNSTELFMVFARPLLIPGMQMPLRLRLYNDQGFEQILTHNLNIGTPAVNTPLGPDSYGYFIYDWLDTAYQDCPVYDWQEIHPSLGGYGELIPLSDAGSSNNEGDQVGSNALAVVDLPFPFSFYGIEYGQITVSTNGFIAMGVTENADFRNYRLPGPMGAAPMIAAFWDDLIIINDAGVYKYHNTEDHVFIIQYHKLRNGYNRTSEETFQVIFYNPMYYPTGLGDGSIKIQYKVFNNVDIGSGGYTPYHGNYSTIGIKDHTNTRGLEYTYNNIYPTAAAPLSHEKAILITTVPVLHQNPYLVVSETIIQETNGNGSIEPGEEVELGIKLSNLGLNTAFDVRLSVSVINNYVTVVNDTTSYSNIPGSGTSVNKIPIKLIVSEDCPANHTINVACLVEINGNNWQYNLSLVVRKPDIAITSVYMNDFLANANGIIEPGETIKLIVNYTNISPVEARNITSNIFCSDNRVTIHNPEQLLDIIPVDTSLQAVYLVSLSDEIPNGTYLTFYLTFLGELLNPVNEQIVVSCGTTGMNTNFESDNGGFTSSPATNAWEWGTSTYAGAHSGTKIWGTRLNTQYPSSAIYSLISPEIYVGQNFVLEFYHKYSMEATYDGGNLKISTNNGGSWSLVHPEGGYNYANVIALNEAGYSGTLTNWTLARFDLSSYNNQNVRFKWTFASDSMVNDQGWFIDDVSTSGHIEFASMISGSVSSSNPDFNPGKILIKATNGMAVHPDDQTNYELFLPLGAYTVTAMGAGYQSQTTNEILTGVANPIITQDFYLGYLAPALNMNFAFSETNLILSWQAPMDPEFLLQGYRIYRRLNADRFELYAQTAETVFSEQITEIGSYQYYVTSSYNEGESVPTAIIAFQFPYTDTGSENDIPLVNMLYHNYPNPFNPTTTIAFSTKNPGVLTLNVYNLKGQLVRRLSNGQLPAGMHRLVWDGRDDNNRKVSSGIYLYRLETKDYRQTRKAMLMK